jgi:hypothetical protein
MRGQDVPFYTVRQRRIKLYNHCWAKEGKDMGKCTGHIYFPPDTFNSPLTDKQVTVAVELVGGMTTAGEITIKLLRAGKDVGVKGTNRRQK